MTVGLLSFGRTGGGLQFNFTFDASALAAPAQFRADVVTGGNILSAAAPHVSATINVTVSYQTSSSFASGSPSIGGLLARTYAQAKTALTANQTTASMVSLVASLPVSDPGFGAYYLSSATQKAYGLLSPTDPGQDITITVGDNPILVANYPAVVAHELLHGLGRASYCAAYNMCRFTASGVYETTWTDVTAFYSVNGGVTKIADFDDTANDKTDFKVHGVQDVALGNPPYDFCDCLVFNPGTATTLSAVDITTLNCCGFY